MISNCMAPSSRVIINTLAQYTRTVFSVFINLYTSRVVLSNLGVDDFGIYSLVAGVISLLGFIQNDLAKTTQRFLSYSHGKNDKSMLVQIFNNSVCTQLMIGVTLCIILFAITPIVFTNILNISPDKVASAQVVYWLAIASLFFDMQCAPYLATLIARENIIFTSMVSLGDTLLKLPVALSLILISNNKLQWYTFLTSSVILLNYIVYAVYCHRKYDECKHFNFKSFKKKVFFEMFSFMGWNVYGTMCIVGRNQGVAILLNRFFSTAINAAYGIGGQVSGQISFLSTAITTAMNPQIIKAEGSGDRNRMFRLAEISCKYSFLLMSIIAIPAIIYMDFILDIWLVQVPEYTSMFCQMIVLAVLIDLTTLNLNTANQAIGNVKVYSISINTIKIMTLPIAYLFLKKGTDPLGVMLVYVILEGICAASRVVFLHINIKLSIKSYFNNVLIVIGLVSLTNYIICNQLSTFFDGWKALIVFLISAITTVVLSSFIGLKQDEKAVFVGLYHKVKHRMDN